MTWQRNVLQTATVTTENLQCHLYLADSYSQYPDAPCHDTNVPADTEYGSIYFGGYTQHQLDSGDESALAALFASLSAASASAAGSPGFNGPIDLQIYYSDAGANPAHAPRVIAYARDWSFYGDELLSSLLSSQDAAALITILETLREQSLTTLGFTEV
jgi:hypothetical protein